MYLALLLERYLFAKDDIFKVSVKQNCLRRASNNILFLSILNRNFVMGEPFVLFIFVNVNKVDKKL